MPRRNLSLMTVDKDPYTLERYPRAFQVKIGKQTYNARQLAKAAKVKGQYLDMYRQPIPAAKVREIMALTGQRPHSATGRLVPASQLAKLRKLAKRELRARQGARVVGPMQYPAAPPINSVAFFHFRPRSRRPGRAPHPARQNSANFDFLADLAEYARLHPELAEDNEVAIPAGRAASRAARPAWQW